MVEKIIVIVLDSLMGLIYEMINQDPYLLPETLSYGIFRIKSPPDEVIYDHEDS